MSATGTCTVCGVERTVKLNGKLREHFADGHAKGRPGEERCEGGDNPPVEALSSDSAPRREPARRARCAACGHNQAVLGNGKVRVHRDGRVRCEGSEQAPADGQPTAYRVTGQVVRFHWTKELPALEISLPRGDWEAFEEALHAHIREHEFKGVYQEIELATEGSLQRGRTAKMVKEEEHAHVSWQVEVVATAESVAA